MLLCNCFAVVSQLCNWFHAASSFRLCVAQGWSIGWWCKSCQCMFAEWKVGFSCTYLLFVLKFKISKRVNFCEVPSLSPWTEFWWGAFNICEISWGCCTCIPTTDGCIPPCSSAQRAVVQAQAMAVITAASLCWGIFVAEGNGLVSPEVCWGSITLQCVVLAKTWGSKLCLFSEVCRYLTASDCVAGSMHCFQGWPLAPSLWLLKDTGSCSSPCSTCRPRRNPCICQWDWRGSSLLRW